MYSYLKSLFFRLNPEVAHYFALHGMALFPESPRWFSKPYTVPASMQQTIGNLHFPNPVGLAAGLDKNGVAVDGLFRCGFGFVEVGTVTPKKQAGNPRPRLFRLIEDEALINRMGFNNVGFQGLQKRLKERRVPGLLGINLGKNKTTPNDSAAQEYVDGLTKMFRFADYFVLNVSSPNTPGLRELQDEQTIVSLASKVLTQRNLLYLGREYKETPHSPPIFVKIAPDLSDEAVTAIAVGLMNIGIDGFIATNTTLSRVNLQGSRQGESGGLSGKPLKARSTEVVRLLYQATKGTVPIIGSGGIFSAEDAYEKILAGASLVQVYTGFIYQGPDIVGDIITGLDKLMQRDGYATIRDAVGKQA